MTKKAKITIGSIALILILAGGICAGCLLHKYTDNKQPNFGKETVLYVYPGMNADDVFKLICDSAAVIRPASLKRAFEDKRVSEYMKPGRYVIKPSSTSVYVARMLNNNWQTPIAVSLSGTMRTKASIARKIANQMLVDSATVYAALCDDELLKNYGFDSKNVFLMFIPDTYEMFWTSGIEDILLKYKKEYDAFWTKENIAKAQAQGLTREEAGILASIVSSETNYAPEMPSVAGVYLNRLHTGMKLQADPTVAFCFDYKPRRILLKHLEVDSPYNTYRYEGLPPGPIAVPQKEALEAVLNPDRHGYLYFCASPTFDGTHKFAETYSEHLKNAAAFQAAMRNR